MLSELPEVQVVGAAANGAEGLALASTLRPDVIVLDVNLPDRNGLEVLEQIMESAPAGVLMLSTLTREGADITMRALELGAVDFLDKASAGTTMEIHRLAPLIREKVMTVAGAAPRRERIPPPTIVEPASPPAPPRPLREHGPFDLVVIGSSTGGPRALMEVIGTLPAGLAASVVVAQHMPAGFTGTLAERINRRSAIRVSEVADGTVLETGSVYIAPGGSQIVVERAGADFRVRVSDGGGEYLHRPSVDLLFRSAAEAAGGRVVGVVLTGMGDDGADGLRTLKEAGARTIVESEETAVIFGMPRAAAPAADRVLRLEEIGRAIAALCGTGAPGGGY